MLGMNLGQPYAKQVRYSLYYLSILQDSFLLNETCLGICERREKEERVQEKAIHREHSKNNFKANIHSMRQLLNHYKLEPSLMLFRSYVDAFFYHIYLKNILR